MSHRTSIALTAALMLLGPHRSEAACLSPWSSADFAALCQAEGVRCNESSYDVDHATLGTHTVEYSLSTPLTPGIYPAVIFLHGGNHCYRDWYRHQVDFTRALGVVTMSIGYLDFCLVGGQSSYCNPIERVDEVAAAVDRLASLSGLYQVDGIVLLGSSGGGAAAIDTMIERPDLEIEGAVLVHPAPMADLRDAQGLPLASWSAAEFARLADVDPGLFVLQLVGQTDEAVVDVNRDYDAYFELYNPSLERFYGEYECVDEATDCDFRAEHGYFSNLYFGAPGRDAAIDTFVRSAHGLEELVVGGGATLPSWWSTDGPVLEAGERLQLDDL